MRKKKYYCLTTIITLIILMISLAGIVLASDYTIFTGDIEFSSPEHIGIPVFVKNNKGFMGFAFEISYNSHQITPISVEPGQLLAQGMFNDNISNAAEGSFKIIFTSSQNIETNGELFLLRFSKVNNQVGDISISMKSLPGETFDENWNEIDFYSEPILINYSNEEKERDLPTEEDARPLPPDSNSKGKTNDLDDYNNEHEIVVQQIGTERVKIIIDQVLDEEGVESIDRIPEEKKDVVTDRVLEQIKTETNQPLEIKEEKDKNRKIDFIKKIYEISNSSTTEQTREIYEKGSPESQSNEVIYEDINNNEEVTRKTSFWPFIVTIILMVLGILTIYFVIMNNRRKTKGGTIRDEKK